MAVLRKRKLGYSGNKDILKKRLREDHEGSIIIKKKTVSASSRSGELKDLSESSSSSSNKRCSGEGDDEYSIPASYDSFSKKNWWLK